MATRHSSGGADARSHSGHLSKKRGKRTHHELAGNKRGERHKARHGLKSRAVVRRTRLANFGALAAGAVGVAAASATGVGELAVGLFSAYVAYRVIRYGVAPSEAIIEGVELEHGKIPKSEANVA